MSRLIIGDIHGCAEELSALVQQAGCEAVVLVGDLFTKGPDPVGVWEQIREGGFRAVLGNHDQWVLNHLDDPQGECPQLDDLRNRAPEAIDWIRHLPLWLDEDPIVVHAGLHPLKGLEGTSRKMALKLRRWPDDGEGNPFWYDAGWKGPRTVVFGHDARRGLVRREREGRPVAIGLDSGCVYGGRLSAWIPEEDRVVSVPALRAYRPT